MFSCPNIDKGDVWASLTQAERSVGIVIWVMEIYRSSQVIQQLTMWRLDTINKS